MSSYSWRLSRKKTDTSWTCQARYPWGRETFQIFETTRADAEKRAKYLCRQRAAHKRAALRTGLQKAGQPVPPELQRQRLGRRAPPAAASAPRPELPPLQAKRKTGRPRKVQPIDPVATAERLRRAAAGAGVSAPGPDLAEDEMTDDGGPPLGTEDPTPVIPPMPDSQPETPEVLDPGGAGAGAGDEGSEEFFADVVAMAYVAGVVRLTTAGCAASTPPRKANDPSPTAVRWTQEGLSQKLRELMGNSTLGPWSKFLLGSAGIVMSMVWGAEVVTPAGRTDTSSRSDDAAGGASANESSGGRPAPAAPPASDLVVHKSNGVSHEPVAKTGPNDYQTPAHGRFKS